MSLGGGGNGAATIFVRYMSRERAPNLRKINPKVPQQEAVSIAEGLYNVIKRNGPLSISNTWNLAKMCSVLDIVDKCRFIGSHLDTHHPYSLLLGQEDEMQSIMQEAGVDGLNSKTHMKIMLKWMRGRKMLKLICNHVGSSKKFLHCTLPEEPQTEQSKNSLQLNTLPEKDNVKRKKGTR